jgi:integrase
MMDCEQYQPLHDCITVDELRWLLHRVQRHTPYYTFFLLTLTGAVRGGEIIRWKLGNLDSHLSTVTYRVTKPKTIRSRGFGAEPVRVHKHRVIILDHWVRDELRAYLERYCRVLHIKGEEVFISPWGEDYLFPWLAAQPSTDPERVRVNHALNIVKSYFNKLRRRLPNGLRLQREWRRHTRTYAKIYVIRYHILRHFGATRYHYAEAERDIRRTCDWIRHDRPETTWGYIHSPENLGLTEEELQQPWPSLLGFDQEQTILTGQGLIDSQRPLEAYT